MPESITPESVASLDWLEHAAREASDVLDRLYQEGQAALATPGENRARAPQPTDTPRLATPPPVADDAAKQALKANASTTATAS